MADLEPGGISSSETIGSTRSKGCIRSWLPYNWHKLRNMIYGISGIPSAETIGNPYGIRTFNRQIINSGNISTSEIFGSSIVHVNTERWAASASSVDIQAAIDLAIDGETINVPAGSVTWTSNVTIPSTKGIKVIGAGIGSTNVNMGGTYQIMLDTRPTNSRVRLSGFSFTNGPSHALQVNNMTVGATNFRIDHCSWNGFTAGNCLYFSGFISGVMDNCNITNCYRPFFIDGQVRPQDITLPYDYPGGYAWKQPLTPAGAVYIEDCTISNTVADIFFNCRGGARFVFRHNTVTGPIGLETHSGWSPGYRNPRWGEMYENTFNTNGGGYWAGAFLRSANGMYYNNSFSTGYSTMMRFDNETTCLEGGTAPWPTSNKTVYPTQDQIGAGLDTGWATAQSTTEAKLRIWNNTLNGVNTAPSNTACAMIAENRDFWQQVTPFTGASGIGVGLLSARPASGLTTGVCYWATDTNTLYRATGATTWETYYTPYTYPHPVTLL